MESTTAVYNEKRLAPYLTVDAKTWQGQGVEARRNSTYNDSDADTAAGGGLAKRVGSFNLLPRTLSTGALRSGMKSPELKTSTKGRAKRETDQKKSEKQEIKPDWRVAEKMKTVGMGIVMALHIGTDPPDLVKPHPCAVLQCWMDPKTGQRATAQINTTVAQEALEQIGERLEQQYANCQQTRVTRPLRKKRAMDPTTEDVRNLCLQLRRHARNDRVLFHYNGHGVPRPTVNGEIWAFDKEHTEYVPIAIADLRLWLGKPSIVVLDCSSAGVLVPFFTASIGRTGTGTESSAPKEANAIAQALVNDTIVLCPCSEGELLPMHPHYPADIFTACLTTPLRVALRWFVRRNPISMSGLDPDAVDAIPGETTDRTTPLGELNWIFAAVTDSIAWNVLPKAVFHRLFRQDLMVASIFRNFLIADRILRTLGCTPVSHPPLPPGIAHHPLWKSWDLACETMLVQLMKDGVLGNSVPKVDYASDDIRGESETLYAEHPTPFAAAETVKARPNKSFTSSPFFSEHLTAFEVWLNFSNIHKMHLQVGALKPPESLPIVLQVLLSQANRIRALHLLRRFLDLGPWAVNLSLSLGIFPYVLKLLSSPDYKSLLVSIWASILAFDPSCRSDMLRSRAFPHFIQHLTYGLNGSVKEETSEAAKQRTRAAFDLAVACHEYPSGQSECTNQNLHGTCYAILSSYEQGENSDDQSLELHLPSHFRMWLCICLGNMAQNNSPIQSELFNVGAHSRLFVRLADNDPDVRAAVCYTLGCLLSTKKVLVRSQSSSSLSNEGQSKVQNIPSLNSQQTQAMSTGILPGRGLQPSNIPGFVQPNFGSQWAAQPVASGQLVALQSQPFIAPSPTFLGQSHFLVQSQPINPAVLASPPGILVGGSSAMGISPMGNTQHQATIGAPFPPQSRPPMVGAQKLQPSVYGDGERFALDVLCLQKLVEAAEDASVIVRYEATVAIACSVRKYLEAFISETFDVGSGPPSPVVDDVERSVFCSAWKTLRSLQRNDPFPPVRKAANETVIFVFEHVLQQRTEEDKKAGLSGIDEELDGGTGALPTAKLSLLTTSSTPRNRENVDLRRVASEMFPTLSDPQTVSDLPVAKPVHNSNEKSPEYELLPESSFFHWKKSSFDVNFRSSSDTIVDGALDPLSPDGAGHLYRSERNRRVASEYQALSLKYKSLAPKPPAVKRGTLEEMLMLDEETKIDDSTSVKKELEMSQVMVLKNEGVKMTSMVHFHSFEDVLMTCGASDALALWRTTTGEKLQSFVNGNAPKTKMTTSTWIEEDSTAMFLSGCDDGTVRIWGNLLESNGDVCQSAPRLVSAFNAAPIVSDGRERGLVCEWQPSSRHLLAGGNSGEVYCWDLATEQKFNILKTESSADLTALCTAWEYDALGTGLSSGRGYQGFGPETVVGGFSDGSLKIFDLRTPVSAGDMNAGHRVRRKRISGYHEHDSWVVSIAFPGYGGRYELISGAVSGEIKAWDLRMSSSTRSMDIQRSIMTSCAVHPKVPILATGSQAQFIKLLTLDGDTLQVIRYHQKTGMKSHRIGPVSCLNFHRYKPLLAVGSADPYVGIYSTKQ